MPGLRTPVDSELIEDTEFDKNRLVNMAVIDGINTGHVTCAFPGCQNKSENYRERRFCVAHDHMYFVCGVYPCGEPVVNVEEGEPFNGACADEAHQALWASHVAIKGGRTCWATVA